MFPDSYNLEDSKIRFHRLVLGKRAPSSTTSSLTILRDNGQTRANYSKKNTGFFNRTPVSSISGIFHLTATSFSAEIDVPSNLRMHPQYASRLAVSKWTRQLSIQKVKLKLYNRWNNNSKQFRTKLSFRFQSCLIKLACSLSPTSVYFIVVLWV